MERDEIPAGTYPMRVATRLSGLSAATVRAWERRYGAVVPDRTEGNARRYSADQVRRLILLRRAVERGHSIGDVAPLPTERLEEMAEGAASPQPGVLPDHAYRRLIDDYLHALDGFEARTAMDILSHSAALLPPRELVTQLLLPLLREVGARWQRGELSVAHEHLVSGQLRSLLGTLIRLRDAGPGAPKVLLATPPGERHEFGALVAAFVVAGREHEPVYLGSEVPWDALSMAVDRSGADLLVLSVAHDLGSPVHDTTAREVRALGERVDVWLGLPDDHPLTRLDLPVRRLHRYEDLDAALLHRLR